MLKKYYFKKRRMKMKTKKRVLNLSMMLICISLLAVGCTTSKATKGAGLGAVAQKGTHLEERELRRSKVGGLRVS